MNDPETVARIVAFLRQQAAEWEAAYPRYPAGPILSLAAFALEERFSGPAAIPPGEAEVVRGFP